MKKFALFLLILLINFIGVNTYAETIKDYYENTKCLKAKYKVKNGLKNGKYIEYFPNKKIKTSSYYINDQLNGDFITYHENGKIKTKSTYINNIKTGLCYGYEENGKLFFIYSYENNVKNGDCITYLQNGKIQATYINDVLIHSVKYNKNGKKEYEEFYKNGYIEKFVSFDNDGFIKEEIIYENQQIIKTNNFYTSENQDFHDIIQTITTDVHSKFKNYIIQNASYINKNVTYNYQNENIYSILTVYDANNNEIFILKILERNDNPINLNFTYFSENEKLNEIFDYNKKIITVSRSYLNDILASLIKKDFENKIIDGTYKFYNEKGNIEFIQTWKNNKLVELEATTYYPNNNIHIKSHSTNNKLNGPFIEYHANGQIKISKTYCNNNLNGKVTLYYPDGQIEAIEYYKNGKANGTFKYYYENGVMSDEVNYINDKLSGTTKIYWQNGVIAYIDTYQNGEKTSRKAFNKFGKQLWFQKY